MINENGDWVISHCAAYIVRPAKSVAKELVPHMVQGGSIPLQQIPPNIYPLFNKEFDQYPVGISFRPRSVNGQEIQENEIRDMIQTIAEDSYDDRNQACRTLALRLAEVTPKISKSGLLVILSGSRNDFNRVLIWKFPREDTIQADTGGENILLQEVQNAFSLESTYLKVAAFEDSEHDNNFWEGKIEDKQAKSSIKEAAKFWIEDFLDSLPEMTDDRGSRLLAKYIRKSIDSTEDQDIKQSLIDATKILLHRQDARITFRDFADNYLSEEAADHFLDILPTPQIADSIFSIQTSEIYRQVKREFLILDNGIIISGPIDSLHEKIDISENEDGSVTVIITGTVINKRIKVR